MINGQNLNNIILKDRLYSSCSTKIGCVSHKCNAHSCVEFTKKRVNNIFLKAKLM